MSEIKCAVPIKQASLVATVIRKDGTVEELGTVAYYHKNPLIRVWYNITRRLGKKLFWKEN